MTEAIFARGGFLRRFQSDFVLRIARLVFLAAAAGCLITIALGLLVAFYFQTQTMSSPTMPAVSAVVPTPTSLDLNRIDIHLVPPRNLRFVVTRGLISEPLTVREVLGHFEADTPNGLSRFPDDFDILGDKDADMVWRVARAPEPPQSLLAASPTLVERVNAARASSNPKGTISLELTVVSRDAYGTLSAPADIVVTLSYGPAAPTPAPAPTSVPTPAPPSAAAPSQAPAPEERLSELQQLARQIALHLDPSKTQLYNKALQRAQQVPQSCGASEATPGFVSNFRRAFEYARAKLTPTSIEAFYAGVCEAWRDLVAEQQAARLRAANANAAAIRLYQNDSAEFEVRRLAGMAGRSVAMYVVGSAFGAFLTLALLLALLAIENHSNALREAAEALTRASKVSPQGAPDPMAAS